MSEQTIYVQLRQAGMSAAGACGLMGNMKAESAMRANNVQDGMGYSDKDYTAKVDAGLIDFINDQRGYGLCQWTYGPRKANLQRYARSIGTSIGNETMQVNFCIKELQSEYAKLWTYLCTTNGVYDAAARICREYERPAVNNIAERAGYANEFFMRFGGPETVPAPGTSTVEPPQMDGGVESEFWPPRVLAVGMYDPDVVALQGLLIAWGYPAGITGSFDAATAQKLMDFQAAHGLKADGIAGPLSWAELVKGAA